MNTKHKRSWGALFLLLTTLLIPLTLTGCGKKPSESPSAIKINNFAMSAAEFNEVFSEYKMGDDTAESRMSFLNNLITRKVLLQEAQRMGLDTRKDFLKSIENFWEQSLLKALVDEKMKEFSAKNTATEKEIQDYYAKWTPPEGADKKPLEEMKSLIAWRMQAAKSGRELDAWTDQLIQKSKIKVDKQALKIE